MRSPKNIRIYHALFVIFLLIISVNADAQVLDQIKDSYKNASSGWLNTILPIARGLFWRLAAIEFAWSAILWALQQDNMSSFTAVVVKKIMGIGFFYALLLNAGNWIPAIINSFIKAGKDAGGAGGASTSLSPSEIFDTGIEAANIILLGIHKKSLWDDFATIVIGGLSALAITIAFGIIAGQLLIALVESYVVISGGILFLGFGGSRWTTDFAQKYLSYAVATGVKLFVLYLILGLGLKQAETWKTMLETTKYVDILSVMGGALVLCFLAFQIPSLAASMLSGSTNLTAGSAFGTGAAVAAGTVAAGASVISPVANSARGGMQALKAGYDHHRATGSGVLNSAVKAIGTSTLDFGKEAGRSAAEAVGLSTPTSSSAQTIGGRAADSRRNQTASMLEEKAAERKQAPPPKDNNSGIVIISAQNKSASNTSSENSSAPSGNQSVGSAPELKPNPQLNTGASPTVTETTRQAQDTLLDNAPQKLGSAQAQSTATNSTTLNTGAKDTGGSSLSNSLSSNAKATTANTSSSTSTFSRNQSTQPANTTDATDATWNSDSAEVRAAGGNSAPQPLPPVQKVGASNESQAQNPRQLSKTYSSKETASKMQKDKPIFGDVDQVRPPNIPNDSAPAASINIRLNHPDD